MQMLHRLQGVPDGVTGAAALNQLFTNGRDWVSYRLVRFSSPGSRLILSNPIVASLKPYSSTDNANFDHLPPFDRRKHQSGTDNWKDVTKQLP